MHALDGVQVDAVAPAQGQEPGVALVLLAAEEDDGRSAKFRQNVARFRLYRRRSLPVKIYQRFALSRVTHKGELRLRDKKFEMLFENLVKNLLKI